MVKYFIAMQRAGPLWSPVTRAIMTHCSKQALFYMCSYRNTPVDSFFYLQNLPSFSYIFTAFYLWDYIPAWAIFGLSHVSNCQHASIIGRCQLASRNRPTSSYKHTKAHSAADQWHYRMEWHLHSANDYSTNASSLKFKPRGRAVLLCVWEVCRLQVCSAYNITIFLIL